MTDVPFSNKKDLHEHYKNVRRRLESNAVKPKPKEPDPPPPPPPVKVKMVIPEEYLVQYREAKTSPRKKLIRQIIADTEDKHKLLRGTLKQRSRKKDIVKARHELMFRLFTEVEGCGHSEIGRILNMDHTTVIHGIRNYDGSCNYIIGADPEGTSDDTR